MLRLVLQREIPEDEALGRQWNELVLQMERPEVFYTYEWAQAVSRAYSASITPLLFLAYQDDTLVGLVALATDQALQQTFFLAGSTADYCDFVCPLQWREELVGHVLSELRSRRMPALALANLPADSATAQVMADVGGRKFFSRAAYKCLQIELRSPEQRQSVLHAVRHKRQQRYLKSLGVPIAVDQLRAWEQVAPVLPEFCRSHIQRFHANGQASNLASPERLTFLTELARLLSSPGWITLSQLRLGERPIAWHYGFQFAHHWSCYQAAFDSDYGEYSPGFNLLLRLIEEACRSPETNLVDLGLGDEAYKKRLATAVQETVHVTVASSAAACLRVAARYHAAAAVKSSPRLEQYVRKLLRRPAAASA